MRSLSLRSGNSPTTPYGGRVNGLQILGFPPPCHPNYRALALTPAGLSPAERASLCWTHVGSRTGAPTVGSGGKSNHFRVGPQSGSHITFPAPASSNAACGFPALRFPACFTSRVMRPIQPSPSRISFASGRAVRSAPFSSRLCLPCRQSRYRQQGRFPPPALPGFTGTTSPPHPLACQPIPGAAVIRPTFAPPISQRGEEGFSSCLARPRHRTVATTPPGVP